MKILVDSCSYNCQNVGDLAMLATAVARLRELWPSAGIRVITNAPVLVTAHCGAVETVPVRGRRLLLGDSLIGRARRLLPARAATRWNRFERRLREEHTAIFESSLRLKGLLRGRDARDTGVFLTAVDQADLVFVNGAGILTDAFEENAIGILTTLRFAIRRNIPTAMMGQGIGPIDGSELRSLAADVLPHVGLLGVRESATSLPLLLSMGVPASRAVVTGDDAIEMAYLASERRRHTAAVARRIGVNIRVAPYAAVGRELLSVLRQVLRDAGSTLGAPAVPVPIAHHGGKMDVETLGALFAGTAGEDGGAALITPQLVIDRIGECRVMLTGSYHGAVFALAQGIPVVALARSPYYVNKMAGLASQFGTGCEVICLEEDGMNLASRLRGAIYRAWAAADGLRAPLLDAACDQISRGRAAYQRLRDLVASETAAASRSTPHFSAMQYKALKPLR